MAKNDVDVVREALMQICAGLITLLADGTNRRMVLALGMVLLVRHLPIVIALADDKEALEWLNDAIGDDEEDKDAAGRRLQKYLELLVEVADGAQG